MIWSQQTSGFEWVVLDLLTGSFEHERQGNRPGGCSGGRRCISGYLIHQTTEVVRLQKCSDSVKWHFGTACTEYSGMILDVVWQGQLHVIQGCLCVLALVEIGCHRF
jgi:hypothetical protein